MIRIIALLCALLLIFPCTFADVTTGLVGYWKFDENVGTATGDSSGNDNNGGLQGGATWQDGYTNTDVNFDGTDDYVSAGTTNLPTTNDGSISVWVKIPPSPSGTDMVLAYWSTASSLYGYYKLVLSGGNRPILYNLCSNGGDGICTSDSGITLTPNTWYHITGTFGGLDEFDSGAIYINAELKATGAFDSFYSVASPWALRIGSDVDATDQCKCAIDELRIYNRKLTTTDINQLYYCQPPTTAGNNWVIDGNTNCNTHTIRNSVDQNLVGWWPLNEGSGTVTKDQSGNGNTGTLVNSPNWLYGKFSRDLNFDGSAQYVNVGNDIENTSSGTLSAWIYPLNKNLADQRFFGIKQGTDTESAVFYGFYDGDAGQAYDGRVHFLIRPTSTTTLIAYGSTNIQSNTWYHIVYTMDPTNGLRIYVDGNLETLTYLTGTSAIKDWWDDIPTSAEWDIGRAFYSGVTTTPFFGQIDDVKVYNRALSAIDVNNLYKETYAIRPGGSIDIKNGTLEVTTNETILLPSGRKILLRKNTLAGISNKFWLRKGGQILLRKSTLLNDLAGWWRFDENTGTVAYDSSGNAKDGNLTNGPVWQTGHSGSDLNFDGSNDYVNVGYTSFGSQSFSTSNWFKTNNTSAAGIFMGKLSGASNWQFYTGILTDGNITFKIYGTTSTNQRTYTTNSGGFNDNQWHNVAISVENVNGSITKTVNVYVDGVLYPNTVTTLNDQANAYAAIDANITIGARFTPTLTLPFKGTMDDVRLYNRTLTQAEAIELYQTT